MSFTANIEEVVTENLNGLLSKHTTWCRVPLGQVAEVLNGFPFDSKRFVQVPAAPLIRIRDIVRGRTETFYDGEIPDGYWVEAGEILIGMDGDFNIARWKSERALLNQRVLKLSAKSSFYNERFLFFVVAGYLQAINEKTPSVTVKHLSSKTVLSIPLPLPPLAEQTRIAAKLDELLAQVDTLKARIDAIPALLKRFRQSVLAAAVSGRLTEEWRIERALPEFFEVELGHLIKEGPQNGLYKPSSAYGSGVKIIRIDGFYSGEITDWGKLRLLDVDQRELEAWGIREGEILINRVNSIEYLGKCALVRSVPEPTVFESNIMRMSLKRDLVHPEYLMRFLSSEVGRKKLIAKAKHAVNQASINQGDVKACKVPLPSVEEQIEIVRRVEQLFAFADQLEAKVTSAKSRIDHLTQSILAKAFRGELVPQDPNDEPASALLERIKTQRAAAPKAKRGRKASA